MPDPRGQPPMPFAAAEAYERTVLAWAGVALPDGVHARLALPFGTHPAQRLDVFTPRGARNAPVLVFWHGGGWTNGYREYVRFMAPHAACGAARHRAGGALVPAGARGAVAGGAR